MWRDPATTNPDHYTVIMENEQVRVLEYTDSPGVARSAAVSRIATATILPGQARRRGNA